TMQTNRRFWVIFALFLFAVGLFAAMWVASPAQAGIRALPARQAPNPVPSCGPQFFAQNTPNSGTTDNALTGVASLAPNDSWAVGFYTNTSGVAQSLIEHWDGSVWS